MKGQGAKGGLCLLWKDKDLVSISSYSNNHIDAEILWEGKRFSFSGIYGFPETSQKTLTWELIRKLHSIFHGYWQETSMKYSIMKRNQVAQLETGDSWITSDSAWLTVS